MEERKCSNEQLAAAETRREAIRKRLREQQGEGRVGIGGTLAEAPAFQAPTRLESSNEASYTASSAMAEDLKLSQSRAAAARMVAGAEAEVTHEVQNTISQRLKDDAVIRAIEGDLTGVRSAGAFLANIPGLSKAFSAAFDVVGFAAVAGIFVDIGKAAYEAIHTINEMPRAIGDSFAGINGQLFATSDALHKTNDDLEDQIAKIEHIPRNGLKDALDEARASADQLAESLGKDYEQLRKISMENNVGVLGQLVGKGSTKEVDDKVKGFADQARQAREEIDDARSRYDSTPVTAANKSQVEAHNQQIDAQVADVEKRFQAQAAAFGQEMDAQVAKRSSNARVLDVTVGGGDFGSAETVKQSYAQVHGDQSAAIEKARNAGITARLMASNIADQAQTPVLTRRLKDDQNAKDAAQQAKEQARTATEAQRKAAEDEIKAMRDGLDAVKAARELSLSQEAGYWVMAARAAISGGLAYATAVDEANKAVARINAETLREEQKTPQLAAAAGSDAAKVDLSERDRPELENEGRATAQRLTLVNESAQSTRETGYAGREQDIAHGEAAGQLSRYDAALQTADLHAQNYGDHLSDLQAVVANVAKTFGLSAEDLKSVPTAIAALNQRPDLSEQDKLTALQPVVDTQKLNEQYGLQKIKDTDLIDQTSLTATWKRTMDQFVQESEDTAKQIGGVFTNTLGGINDSRGKTLTEHIHPSRERNRAMETGVGEQFRGSAAKLTTSALDKAEGSVLKEFGFGGAGTKPDGSSSNPLWVKFAGALGLGSQEDPGAPGAPSLLSKLPFVPASLRPRFGGGGVDPLGLNLPKLNQVDLGGGDNDTAVASLLKGIGNTPASVAGPRGGGAPELSGLADLSKGIMPVIPEELQNLGKLNSNPLLGGSSGPSGDEGSSTSLMASLFGGLRGGADSGDDSGGGMTTVAQGGLSDLSKAGAGIFSEAGKLLPMFQGFFAAGGDVVADRPSIIGEKGPEMFIPKVAGTIVPNNQIQNNGDIHHHINVDATGASDPGATEAAVDRALRKHTPTIISATMSAMSERDRRTNRSAR